MSTSTSTFSQSLGATPGLEGLRARELRVLARLFDVVTVSGRFVPDPARELVMVRTGTVVDDDGGTHGPGTVLWAPVTAPLPVELLVLDRRARRDALEAVRSLASRLDGAPGLRS